LTGPRDYSAGTERALFLLAQRTCYYPECPTPVITFVEEGVPVVNVQIAHISGAKLGSARFDPAMSDKERAAFDNVMLLCKPHHNLVDRIEPDRFPTDMLKKWKADREGPGNAALRGLQGLTEDRLEEMLEAAIRTAGPQREVTVDVAAGVLLNGQGAVTIPLDGWRTALDLNPSTAGQWVVATTARNTGGLPASITGIGIWFRVEAGGVQLETSLLGRNDFPFLNPSLPVRLDVGEATNWLTSLGTFEFMTSQVARTLGAEVTEFRVDVHLGSGEKIQSTWHAIALVPLGQT
jgi:hypothetical protein